MKTLLLLFLLQSPADLYKAANADMDAGRFAEAAAKLEQVLKEDPTHIPSEFNLAVCYSKAGNNTGAELLYRKIVEQDPEVYEAHINLGILLFNADNNSAAADEQFAKAANLRPQDPVPARYRARILDKRGDSAGAAENYERVIQLDPSDTETLVSAGIFYLQAQQMEKAYAHLTAAEQQGVKSPRLFIALSEAEHIRRNEDRSIAYLQKAIAVDPENLLLRRQLAAAYFEKKDYVKAAPILELLAASEPGNTDYLYRLGKAQMESKQYAKALTSLQTLLKAKPDDPNALSTLASTYQLQEDWAHAVPVIERFIQLKPRDAFAYFMLASSYDRLGNIRQALLNYNKFLSLDDGSSDARSFQARERAKILEKRLKK